MRPFIDEVLPQKIHAKLKCPRISDEQWKVIAEVVEVLQPAYITTIRMQREKYVPSDFYADWVNLKLQLEKLQEIRLAANIVVNMTRREKGLIDTPNIMASVYIDPRMRVLLTDDQIGIAKRHLSDVRKRLKIDVPQQPTVMDNSAFSELSQLIKRRKMDCSTTNHIPDNDFFAVISNSTFIDDLGISPIDYWLHLETSNPEIHRIISTVNAAAPTQVSVERGFSALAFIMDPRRTRLGDKILNDILVLRLNDEFLHSNQIKLL